MFSSLSSRIAAAIPGGRTPISRSALLRGGLVAAAIGVAACSTNNVLDLRPEVDVGSQTAAVPSGGGMQNLVPNDPYLQPYWERLQKLKYDFINGNMDHSIATALRFTLSVPGVHTMIVGTTKPGRWRENAELLAAGPLPAETFERIRARWRQVADESWVGQV